MSEVARYRILAPSYINKQLLFEGDEVDYEGKPGSALEPINDAAKEAKKKADKNYVEPKPEDEKPSVPKPEDEKPSVPKPEDDGSNQADVDLAALREEYEALFNTAPHPAMKADTMKTKIAEKRAELGV
ncbi:hypothetical protein [Rahnella sp. PCH160]|uniref:hypothetical protein n=1 Tax=Rahnella sp. PCH160 TaxID=3447928 RepID=UPI0039FDD36C